MTIEIKMYSDYIVLFVILVKQSLRNLKTDSISKWNTSVLKFTLKLPKKE